MKNPNPRIQASPNDEATYAEERLWQALRQSAVGGFKFRRQHVIGSFVVDFYCVSARLVLEVDGPVHDDPSAADLERQAILESLGLTVLRFTNDEVINSLASVLQRLEVALRRSRDVPLSSQGEGLGER